MKQIFIFEEDNNKLEIKQIMDQDEYKKEDEIQSLIKNNSKLIEFASIFDEPIMIIEREIGKGSLRIDVLALTANAAPVVIECKRISNPDMRLMIAQIFDYASMLSSLNYTEFDGLFKGEKSLYAAFQKFLEGSPNVISDIEDEDSFIGKVKENLQEGNFYLVLVVDKIRPDTLKAIEFLNKKLDGNLRIEVVELLKYSSNEKIKAYIPRHINPPSLETKEKKSPGKTTFNEMKKNAGKLNAEYLDLFYDNWAGEGYSIKMGTKGFSAQYKQKPVLWVLTNSIKIPPKNNFQDRGSLFNSLLELIPKYFNDCTEFYGKFSSTNLNSDKFIEEVKSFLK